MEREYKNLLMIAHSKSSAAESRIKTRSDIPESLIRGAC